MNLRPCDSTNDFYNYKSGEQFSQKLIRFAYFKPTKAAKLKGGVGMENLTKERSNLLMCIGTAIAFQED